MKINKDFNKTAQSNAIRTGLTKQVKKSQEEIKTEDVKDEVSLNQSSDNIEAVPDQQPFVMEEKSDTEDPLSELKQQLALLPAGDYLLQLLNEGKLSKEELQKVLEVDAQRRQEEMMIQEHDISEKEALKDSWLNMWVEAGKVEKERIKRSFALMDYMKTANSEIAQNRIATNKAIQSGWLAAMFAPLK